MGLKYETARYEASYGAISQLPSPETQRWLLWAAQTWESLPS